MSFQEDHMKLRMPYYNTIIPVASLVSYMMVSHKLWTCCLWSHTSVLALTKNECDFSFQSTLHK